MRKTYSKIEGEKTIAGIMLSVMPLVEKYFKDFDGERAILKDGSESAKFSKLTKAFNEEAHELVDKKMFRIYISTGVSSAYIKADIALPDGPETVSYYESTMYFGKVDSGSWNRNATGEFTFEFDSEGYTDTYTEIANTTEESLKEKGAKIKALEAEIENLKNTVPYTLRGYM